MSSNINHRISLKRGGVHPDFLVKLVFKIAVPRETSPVTELLRGSWTVNLLAKQFRNTFLNIFNLFLREIEKYLDLIKIKYLTTTLLYWRSFSKKRGIADDK